MTKSTKLKKCDLHRATTAHAAAVVGKTARMLRNWADEAPAGVVKKQQSEGGKVRLKWSIPALFAWRVDVEATDAAKRAGEEDEDLKKWRRVRADRAEFEFEKEKGKWYRVDSVKKAIFALADAVRSAGDKLQRTYGPEAQELLDRKIDDAADVAMHILSEDVEETAKGASDG